MASAEGAITLPGVGSFNMKEMGDNFKEWMSTQHPAVEIAFTAAGSSLQGAFLGYLLGQFTKVDPETANQNPQMAAQMKALSMGGPWQQARNLGVMTGVNAGLGLAIKKYRGGVDDVWGAMGAAFGAGCAFSLVSGAPNPAQAAITTGCAFAAFNGLFYQIGQAFKPAHDDSEYDKGKYMLQMLGLQRFEGNLKKGELTDSTIMLWNESSLAEARIPPGPRLLILHHIDQYRNPSNILKPALPLPGPPPKSDVSR